MAISCPNGHRRRGYAGPIPRGERGHYSAADDDDDHHDGNLIEGIPPSESQLLSASTHGAHAWTPPGTASYLRGQKFTAQIPGLEPTHAEMTNMQYSLLAQALAARNAAGMRDLGCLTYFSRQDCTSKTRVA
ncbi:predicted protein [Coccidioides posadasii str. Silveira]|uniref:Predicted protein n=2 Tax=Coccidioides posadasii TaxID=199306 RepID=E9DCG1_COCPS|nr:predicted protein [Coccidioides posadasii str. Silveira]KMM69197.1 hypothetical protein CPAG_05518 [Coccidioides posadasii RMSCC 3488]